MDDKELKKILKKHLKWVNEEKGGERADLYNADLSNANLSNADLSNADLYNADLSNADLSNADLYNAKLSYAILYNADLSGTILEGINWLAYIGIVPDHQGTARAYKIMNNKGEGIFQGGINYLKANKFKVDDIDTDVFTQCGAGINLATFAWCLNRKRDDTHRLIMFSFNVKDVVCPVATDGKFRVSKCRKIGECDWQGNLLPKATKQC